MQTGMPQAQAEQIEVLTKALEMQAKETDEPRENNIRLKANSKNKSKLPSSDGYGKSKVKN